MCTGLMNVRGITPRHGLPPTNDPHSIGCSLPDFPHSNLNISLESAAPHNCQWDPHERNPRSYGLSIYSEPQRSLGTYRLIQST